MKPKSASYKKQTQSFTRKTKKKIQKLKAKKAKKRKTRPFSNTKQAPCIMPHSTLLFPRTKKHTRTRACSLQYCDPTVRNPRKGRRSLIQQKGRKAERQTGRLGLAHALAWTSWLDYVQEVSPCFSDGLPRLG